MHRHFLSFGRADLTASASLQPNRSSHRLLMNCCLAATFMLGWGGSARLVNNLGEEPGIVFLWLYSIRVMEMISMVSRGTSLMCPFVITGELAMASTTFMPSITSPNTQ
jgi:hypothetical protein